MDRALRTDDLIREIFSHLRMCGRGAGPYVDSRTLYYSALSCKRFSSHALDALWFSLHDLEPLMSLIPNTKPASDGGFYLTRPLKKEDVSTFDRYAGRIKEYYEYEGTVSTRYRVPVMLDLLQCLDRHHLLPNLRHIYVDSVEMPSDSPDFNTFLLCPNLRYLSTTFHDNDHAASGFPRIVRLAPHLRRLEVMNVSIPEDLLPLLSSFHSLQEMSALNDFVVTSKTFSSTFFPFSSQLKIWRLASISINPADLSRTRAFGCPTPQFPALTELEFLAPKSFVGISEAFAHNLFPQLVTLTIRVVVSTDGRNGGWAKLFSALFSKKSCIQFIQIRHCGGPSRRQLNVDDNDTFAPLENGEPQDLMELDVQVPLQKSLPASSIRVLVSVFPHLCILHIAAVQISFADLALLAQGLPHLRLLRIGIDGNTLSPNQIYTLPLLSHGLRTLQLDRSNVGDAALFARCLDRLFPFVQILQVLSTPRKTIEMAGLLALMRSRRKDQEARIDQEEEKQEKD
ncbi:hypothetical protein D9619_009401 [Psilocybe cf. subviscida]|uniref:F-box domain-containing protein n=1 Tax=Psilocybe cf. subviscida TaxID=2480587 RepID=A0A8H5FAU9_9AGAR|nr:hypothetical protein D9619_009401 [Psilocybe cf. subviscida]